MQQQEVVENWSRLTIEMQLPADARFRFLELGKKGFLGVGKKKTKVTWCVDPKWKIQWRKRRAAFDYFVPVIVCASTGEQLREPEPPCVSF